jgi:predicted dienelactone hydrolase
MRRSVIVTALVATLVGATLALATPPGPVGAGDQAPSPRGIGHAGLGPLAPPDRAGPWLVGLTTVEMSDPSRDGRTLAVDLWYPVDEGREAPTASLDLLVTHFELPGVLADADAAAGRFPLMVFSHGNGGVRFQSWFLMQALASHGFVVAAPDHTGNTAFDSLFGTSDPAGVVARNRPLDVSFVIDEVLAQNDRAGGRLTDRIDPERIAVGGHSFGGFTALAVAGGFGEVPADPRVEAVVPIAAAAMLLSDAELAAVDVPTLLLSGTSDTTVPLVPTITRAWDLVSGRPAYRADVHAGGHSSFTNACDLHDALADAGLPPELLGFLAGAAAEACGPDLLPVDEAHRLTTLYTVAFLQSTVGEDPRYRRYLTPGRVARDGLAVDWYAAHGAPRTTGGHGAPDVAA